MAPIPSAKSKIYSAIIMVHTMHPAQKRIKKEYRTLITRATQSIQQRSCHPTAKSEKYVCSTPIDRISVISFPAIYFA